MDVPSQMANILNIVDHVQYWTYPTCAPLYLLGCQLSHEFTYFISALMNGFPTVQVFFNGLLLRQQLLNMEVNLDYIS